MDKKQTSYLNELISGYKQHLCYSLRNFTENKENITLGRNGALIWSQNKVEVRINSFVETHLLDFGAVKFKMETRGMVSNFEDNLVLTDGSNPKGIILSTNLLKFVGAMSQHPQYGHLIREGNAEDILINKGINLKPIMMYNPNKSKKISFFGFHERDNIKTSSNENLTDKISNFFMKPNEQL
jgi:hypothetical protein